MNTEMSTYYDVFGPDSDTSEGNDITYIDSEEDEDTYTPPTQTQGRTVGGRARRKDGTLVSMCVFVSVCVCVVVLT